MQPPMGPDSTRPMGWRQVRSVDSKPPLEPIMKSEPPKALALEIIIEPPNVGAHLRPDVGVGRYRRAPLVLIPLAGQIRAEGDISIRQKFFELLGGGFFMGRVDIGIHEKNRHRLDAKLFDFIGELFQSRRVERRDHFAFAAHPLGDFEAQLARNQGLVALIVEIEGVGAVAAGDFQNVAKTFAGHQRRLSRLCAGSAN